MSTAHSVRLPEKLAIELKLIIDEEDNIILKTAYPSRKWHKIYRG